MKIFSLLSIFIAVVFIASMSLAKEVSVSNAFGWLGFSIAVGSIGYFAVFAPYGFRTHTAAFGLRQTYKHPVPEIPGKVFWAILVPVIVCLAVSFGFYTNGS